jgi:hypothetical protein
MAIDNPFKGNNVLGHGCGEKSYAPYALDQCGYLGGKVTYQKWAGVVPFFCLDRVARFSKWLEPFVEYIPVIKNFDCAVYTFSASSNP